MIVCPVGHMEGTDFLFVRLSSSTLLLPHSLVLAAVLVVVTGARVALAPSHRDAVGALVAGAMTWILSGRGNVAADHLTIRFESEQQPFVTYNLSVGVPYLGVHVQGCP